MGQSKSAFCGCFIVWDDSETAGADDRSVLLFLENSFIIALRASAFFDFQEMEIIPRQLRQGQCCGEIQGLYSEKEGKYGRKKKYVRLQQDFSCMDVYGKIKIDVIRPEMG